MFEIYQITPINSDFSEPDDFSILAHCEISKSTDKGGEAFTAQIISPKRLTKCVQDSALLGRGMIILNAYDENLIVASLNKIIEKAKSWDEVKHLADRYFDWID